MAASPGCRWHGGVVFRWVDLGVAEEVGCVYYALNTSVNCEGVCLGLYMQYQQWVDDCSFLMDWFRQELKLVQTTIKSNTGPAFYQEETNKPLIGVDARCAIALYLGKISYADNDLLDDPTDVFAAAALPELGCQLLQHLNVVKTEFREFHERIRASFPTGKEGTDAIRQILRHCDDSRLLLDAVDRQVPVITAPITKLAWHYNGTIASKRRTIEDAVQALYTLQAALGDDYNDQITTEIARLESEHSLGLPVAQLMHNEATVSLHLAYSYIDPEGVRCREVTYGKNPVIFLDKGIEPRWILPKEITGLPDFVWKLCCVTY